MPLAWTKPLSFAQPTGTWRGEVSVARRKVEIHCYTDNAARLTSGKQPATKLADQMLANAEKAIERAKSDRDRIAAALAELWNTKWRAKNGTAVSSTGVSRQLKLKNCNLYQGVESGNFMSSWDVGSLFDGYFVQTMWDAATLTRVCIQTPRDPVSQKPLLPNLLESKAVATLPSDVKDAKRVSNTPQRTATIAWKTPLRFDKRRSSWIGALAIRGKAIKVVANDRQSKTAPSWITDQLKSALPQLSGAHKEAITKLTELYNDSWTEGRDLSEASVRRRVKTQSIELSESGDWSLWMDDGELFGGHHVRVDIDAEGVVSIELLG